MTYNPKKQIKQELKNLRREYARFQEEGMVDITPADYRAKKVEYEQLIGEYETKLVDLGAVTGTGAGLVGLLRSLGSRARTIGSKGYQMSKVIGATGFSILKDVAVGGKEVIQETAQEYRNSRQNPQPGNTNRGPANRKNDLKDFKNYIEMMQTAPQRFQERLDQLAMEGRQLSPIREVNVRILGGAIVAQQEVNANEIQGYIINPITGKAKKYTMRYNGRRTGHEDPLEPEVV